MSATDLLAEIAQAFPNTPSPGPTRLAANNAAAQHLPAILGGQPWPDVPDEVLHGHATSLALLSPVGFRYYLPAFLGAAIREPAHPSGASLLDLLTLPTEVAGPVVAQLLAHFEAASPLPTAMIASLMQEQFSQTNQALHHFIARSSQLSPAQGKVICHFLAYWQEQGGAASQPNMPALAIERYWFQFA